MALRLGTIRLFRFASSQKFLVRQTQSQTMQKRCMRKFYAIRDRYVHPHGKTYGTEDQVLVVLVHQSRNQKHQKYATKVQPLWSPLVGQESLEEATTAL
jgi:hypothetical protein